MTRTGIGKFYMGREIAQVMGHEAADWWNRPERVAEERPTNWSANSIFGPVRLWPTLARAQVI